MAGCDLQDRNVRIALCSSCCCVAIGAILILIGMSRAQQASNFNWDIQDAKSGKMVVESGQYHCGFVVLTREGVDCNAFNQSLTFVPPGPGPLLEDECANATRQTYEFGRQQGTLVLAAHINVTNGLGDTLANIVPGEYSLSSNYANFWVMDYCNELAELLAGLSSAISLMLVAIVCFISSCVMCCVSCCLCNAAQTRAAAAQQQQPQGGPQVIGQPVQGQVVVGTVVPGSSGAS